MIHHHHNHPPCNKDLVIPILIIVNHPLHHHEIEELQTSVASGDSLPDRGQSKEDPHACGQTRA